MRQGQGELLLALLPQSFQKGQENCHTQNKTKAEVDRKGNMPICVQLEFGLNAGTDMKARTKNQALENGKNQTRR